MTARWRVAAWALGGVLAAGAVAPIGVLWLPGAGKLRAHSYQWLMYAHIASRLEQGSRSTEEFLDRAAEYAHTHLWPAGTPYEGKPLDYLVRGTGWCDYMAKVYTRLLAARGIPARYAMLRDANGDSPHTVAEAYYQGAWGLHDVLLGVRFVDARGAPLSLERLSPDLVDAQPLFQREERGRSIRAMYVPLIPALMPPTRSHVNLTRQLSPFDRLLMRYVAWGGAPFVAWYQDRYLASTGLRPSEPAELLVLARHWHLAGRTQKANAAYAQCLERSTDRAVRSDARFWLGLLHWELEGRAAEALEQFQALLQDDPDSHWTALAWYYGGRCEEALGRPERARERYAAALSREVWAAWRRL